MMQIFQTPSSHHDARVAGGVPRYVILHYTGTRTAREASEVYLGRVSVSGGRISPHYMIDTDGSVTQFVPESRRAWHAGVSFWRGQEDLNSLSIGIEIVNEGEGGGYPPYAPEQREPLILLCKNIMQRHDIPSGNVLGHSDVAPSRRCDPGPALEWERLAREGIGLWPSPGPADRAAAADIAAHMDAALRAYGYDPQAGPDVVLRAFRSHFHPQALNDPGSTMLLETAARLSWLMRHNPAGERRISAL